MGLQRIISTKKGIIFVFVGFLVFSWIFSGCLQIGKFPPEIKKALADSTAEYPSANNGGWDADESNAYTDDTSYASTTPNTNSTESVEYGSFGFDSLIPTGSTINSVTIELVWYMSTSASNATLRVDALVNNGVVGTQESDTTEPTSDKTTSYENDYGSWSRDDLLDGVFEVRVGAQRGGGSTGYTMYLDYVKVTVDYSALTTPTVSTQAASSVEISTATGNGNIISTGGENADKRGFVYDTSTKSLPGNVAPTSSGYAYYAEDSGSYGTGAFTKGLSSLSANVTYYIRAYAHNSAGYSYGGEVNFLTKPDSPSTINFTNICLDSLRINWIAPAGGASSYKIERCEGTGCSDFLQITSGETNVYYDDSGLSAGTTYRYRVRATNATGDSDYCAPDETTTEAASISIVVEDGSGTVSYGIVNTDLECHDNDL